MNGSVIQISVFTLDEPRTTHLVKETKLKTSNTMDGFSGGGGGRGETPINIDYKRPKQNLHP